MGPEAGGDVVYAFWPYRLEARSLKLKGVGLEVDLDMTPRRLLLGLLERAGEIVSKEDLIKAAWGGGGAHDDSLYQHMSVLRKELGGGRDKYIINVPGVGYKFVASVEIVTPIKRVDSHLSNEQTRAVTAKTDEARPPAAKIDETADVKGVAPIKQGPRKRSDWAAMLASAAGYMIGRMILPSNNGPWTSHLWTWRALKNGRF